MKNNLYKLLFEARFYSKNDFLIFLYRLIEKKEETIDRVNNQILLDVFNFLNKKDENGKTIYELLTSSQDKKEKDSYNRYVYTEVNKKYGINLDKLNDYYEYMLDFIDENRFGSNTSYDDLIKDFDFFEKNIKNSLLPDIKKELIDVKNEENLNKIIQYVRELKNEKQSEFDASQSTNIIYENDKWIFIHPKTEAQFRYNSFLIYQNNNLEYYKPDSNNLDWCTIERHGAGTSAWHTYCKRYVCIIAISKVKDINDNNRKISLKLNRPEETNEQTIKDYFFFHDSPSFDLNNDEVKYENIIKIFSEEELNSIIEYINSESYFNYTDIDEEKIYKKLKSMFERKKIGSITSFVVNNSAYYLLFRLRNEFPKETKIFNTIINNIFNMFEEDYTRLIYAIFNQLKLDPDLESFIFKNEKIKSYFDTNIDKILEKLLATRLNKELIEINPIIAYILKCENNEILLTKLSEFISQNLSNKKLEKIVIFTIEAIKEEDQFVLSDSLKLALINFYKKTNISSQKLKKLLCQDNDTFIKFYNNNAKNIISLFRFDIFSRITMNQNNILINKIKELIPENSNLIIDNILKLMEKNSQTINDIAEIIFYDIENIINKIQISTFEKVNSYETLFALEKRYQEIFENFDKFNIEKIKLLYLSKISSQNVELKEKLIKKVLFKKIKTKTLFEELKLAKDLDIVRLKASLKENNSIIEIMKLIIDLKEKIKANEITNNEELEEFVKTKNITEMLKRYVQNNIYIINERLLIK